MKNSTDQNLGEVFHISVISHIPDSWLNLLNGYDIYIFGGVLSANQPLPTWRGGMRDWGEPTNTYVILDQM